MFLRDGEVADFKGLIKRCVLYIIVLDVVCVVAWGFDHLLAPFFPTSKFLLDAISDLNIFGGLAASCLSLMNWREIYVPWWKSRQRVIRPRPKGTDQTFMS